MTIKTAGMPVSNGPFFKYAWVDGAARLIMILLVFAAIIGACYLLIPRSVTPRLVEGQTRAARAWADKLGVRITGASCNGRSCTVAPENGRPITLFCDVEACSLERCAPER